MAQPLAIVPNVDESSVGEAITVGQVKVSQTLTAGGHSVDGGICDACTLLELWNNSTVFTVIGSLKRLKSKMNR